MAKCHKSNRYEEITYPASTYVWCKGSSTELSRHPIFVSSPVRFVRDENGRHVLLRCQHKTCSLCGQPTTYGENEMAFQTGMYLLENRQPDGRSWRS